MRLEELKEGVIYRTDVGYVFKLEDQKLLIRDVYYNEWTEAIKLLPITALAGFIYENVFLYYTMELKPNSYLQKKRKN